MFGEKVVFAIHPQRKPKRKKPERILKRKKTVYKLLGWAVKKGGTASWHLGHPQKESACNYCLLINFNFLPHMLVTTKKTSI